MITGLGKLDFLARRCYKGVQSQSRNYQTWSIVMNRNAITPLLCLITISLLCWSSVTVAQETDPTKKSDMIKTTMSKIRDVEKLDTFIAQNNTLKQENAKLKSEVASIKKQLTKLQADLKQQDVKIRKQLLQMPTFQVQSKVISGKNSVAYLKTKDTLLRVRSNMKMSVPISDGVWVLMDVKEISKDMIVLEFPELERTVYLYH